MNRAQYRKRVDAALDLWSALTIQMPWHPHHKKTMPPPIEVMCSKGSSLTVTVTFAWRDFGKKETGYFKQVPLPLPHDAATQNLVLTLLSFDCDGETMRRTAPLNREGLGEKIGLTHPSSYRAFSRTCFEADKWLRKHGVALVKWSIEDKKVFFDIKNLKIKPSKAQIKEQDEKASEETKSLMETMSQLKTKDEYRKVERWFAEDS